VFCSARFVERWDVGGNQKNLVVLVNS